MISFPSRPVVRHVLGNGLRVVLQPDNSLPLVAVNLWYHVGSKDERPGLTGLAHLFEHMLFQGSLHVGTNDHFRLIQQVGGVANGSTWFDRTNYYQTLPANYLDLALWLESDRMGFLVPALDQLKLDTQREVVINERRQRIDNQPYGRALERIHEILYPPDHPYHWPVIGYTEDIAAATLEDLESFFRTYYSPSNAVLTLVGDFSSEAAIARVEDFFGEFPQGPPTPIPNASLPPAPATNAEQLPDRVQLPRIYVACTVPPYGESEWYAADLLASVLAGGKSSPLYRDLVYSRQIATDVSCFAMPTRMASTFLIVATARPDTRLEELEHHIDRHLAEVAADAVEQVELDRAVNKTILSFCDELQQLDQRADLLSMNTVYFDDPGRLDRELEMYLGVRSRDLSSLALSYLGADRRLTLRVVPDKTRG